MKIIRYQDPEGNIAHAAQQADGAALELAGGIFDNPRVTEKKADVAKLLAPLVPSSIICIGLNDRRHAEETGAKTAALAAPWRPRGHRDRKDWHAHQPG